MASTPAFIFIPDISGFTQFVSGTELTHSQHIISELLELIIEANVLELTVAEIEGDAVLFYREGPPPTPAELEQQTESLFLAFHNYLESYKTRRLCQCGACSTASELSLKMIAHFGEIVYVEVREFKKPHGPELILAHRLLKNDIQNSEYLLVTQALFNHWNPKDLSPSWEMHPGTSTYDQFGEVQFQFTHLDRLHLKVQELPPVPHHTSSHAPLIGEVFINRPVEEVFEIVSNLSFRTQWTPGIEGFDFEPDRVNRVGTKHQCVIGGKNREIITITKDLGPTKRVYGEYVADPPIVEEMSIYYIMEPKETGTQIRQELHYTPKKGLSRLLVPFFKRFSQNSFQSVASNLKRILESEKMGA